MAIPDSNRDLKDRRPSLKDVAAKAGVSRATASRALSGCGPAARTSLIKVQTAAAELRYVPNAQARSLKQQRSNTIGVLVTDLRNPFYAEVAAGVGAAARKAGYAVLLADAAGEATHEIQAAHSVVEMRIAGLVSVPVTGDAGTYVRKFGIPVVEVDRRFAEDESDGVVVANRDGARKITEHLLQLGHRRIAVLIDETHWTTGHERLLGYKDAFAAAQVPTSSGLVAESPSNVDMASATIERLLKSENTPTAIFAANNVLVEGAYRALQKCGKAIPDDVSLVSFDDSRWMSMVRPGITAISQDVSSLGSLAVERLLGRIANPMEPARTIVLPTKIIWRGSCARPKLE